MLSRPARLPIERTTGGRCVDRADVRRVAAGSVLGFVRRWRGPGCDCFGAPAGRLRACCPCRRCAGCGGRVRKPRSSMLAPQASLTRSPLRPSSTARAACVGETCSPCRGTRRVRCGPCHAATRDGPGVGGRIGPGWRGSCRRGGRSGSSRTRWRAAGRSWRSRACVRPATPGTARRGLALPSVGSHRRRWPTGRTGAGRPDRTPGCGRGSGRGTPQRRVGPRRAAGTRLSAPGGVTGQDSNTDISTSVKR
jgi:hypothetical protein